MIQIAEYLTMFLRYFGTDLAPPLSRFNKITLRVSALWSSIQKILLKNSLFKPNKISEYLLQGGFEIYQNPMD